MLPGCTLQLQLVGCHIYGRGQYFFRAEDCIIGGLEGQICYKSRASADVK